MRLFHCTHCGSLVFFDSTECLGCGATLAFDPQRLDMVAVQPVADAAGTWELLGSSPSSTDSATDLGNEAGNAVAEPPAPAEAPPSAWNTISLSRGGMGSVNSSQQRAHSRPRDETRWAVGKQRSAPMNQSICSHWNEKARKNVVADKRSTNT